MSKHRIKLSEAISLLQKLPDIDIFLEPGDPLLASYNRGNGSFEIFPNGDFNYREKLLEFKEGNLSRAGDVLDFADFLRDNFVSSDGESKKETS